MARIKKQGLDYFPMSVDFIHDRLVRRIMKREGDASLSVLLETLSYIYAGEGYYVRADDFFYEDLSSNLYEKNGDDVKRVIALAVEYGVFDAGLFGEYGILTSADIQRQYIFSTKRRNALRLDPAYCLIDEEPLSQPSRGNGVSGANRRKIESVKSVNESDGKLFVNTDEQEDESSLKANVNKTENVTLIPENVTSGTHSIAQQSIAKQRIEKTSLLLPLPKGSRETRKGWRKRRGRFFLKPRLWNRHPASAKNGPPKRSTSCVHPPTGWLGITTD